MGERTSSRGIETFRNSDETDPNGSQRPLSPFGGHAGRLDEAGFAASAFAVRDLANAVARHKTMFFAEKASDRTPIDYAAAVNGGLRLVPVGDGLKALEEDYARMVDDGLLLEDAEPFEALMECCAGNAVRANSKDK